MTSASSSIGGCSDKHHHGGKNREDNDNDRASIERPIGHCWSYVEFKGGVGVTTPPPTMDPFMKKFFEEGSY